MLTKKLGFFLKHRVSEIRVNQIRVNQGLGVLFFHFWKELKEVFTSQPYLLYVRHYKPRLVYFYPIFHCGLYFRAASIADKLKIRSL